jgi:vacuolar protein sorting-associated protein IST1
MTSARSHLRIHSLSKAVHEGVCSIIYAAPRTELKGIYIPAPAPVILLSPVELHVLRDILMHKYGREFSLGVMENRNSCITDRVCKLFLP